MNIRIAMDTLREHLQTHPWFINIGKGRFNEEEAIYIYVSSAKAIKTLESSNMFTSGRWEGFPVLIRRSAAPRPLAWTSVR